MKKSILATVIGASVLAMSAGVMADDTIATTAGVTVSGGAGVYGTDKERELHHDNQYNAGVGYRFNKNWETELTYMQSNGHDGKGSNEGVKADLKNLRLDGTYYLSNGRFQPYLSAGIGRNTYDYSNKEDNKEYQTELNVGVGVKYFATPSIFLRAEARAFDAKGGVVDTAATFGVGYQFGQTSHVVEPEPVVDMSDDDNDGVINTADNCPNTPTLVTVDEHGCAVASDIPVQKDLQMEFAFGSDQISSQYDGDFSDLAAAMNTYPTGKVMIVGHTDSKGAESFNQTLSKKRANTVANKFVNQYGIDSARITTVGKGETDPVASNETTEGRKQNRRVVVSIEALEPASK